MIVNEFGEIGIDNDLIVESDEEIYEMNNGCICCTVRGDLNPHRRGADAPAGPRFDAILIETTGLADPAPVAQTFFMDDDVRSKTRLDAVVALVDAKHLPLAAEGQPGSRRPDRLRRRGGSHKIDLVSEEELQAVEASVRAIQSPLPPACHRTERVRRGTFGSARPRRLQTSSGPSRTTRIFSRPLTRMITIHDHAHDTGRDFLYLGCGGRGAPAKWTPRNSSPGSRRPPRSTGPPNILRLKGIIAIKDDRERYVAPGRAHDPRRATTSANGVAGKSARADWC